MNNHCNEKMPPWAQRADSFHRKHCYRDKAEKSRKGEYAGAIIFNLIFLWIVNNIEGWNLGFIRDNFSVVLWILNVNILVQIGGNLLMFLISLPAIRYLSLIITESASFVTQMVVYYIYPFDFTNVQGLSWLDWLIPVLLIIGMVVSALKVISNLWKLIFGRS